MPMIERGKCPKCDHRLSKVNVEYAEICGYNTTYKGVSYVCPHCSAVLSVSIDPLAVKNLIVSEVLKALGKG
jgi:hypothetical protein